MAFQPIVDVGAAGMIYAHEALVRGRDGRGAMAVIAGIATSERHAFDEFCRIRAIEIACRLGLPARLSVNVLPSAICEPERGIHKTLEAAHAVGFPLQRLILEITEDERITDYAGLRRVLKTCKAEGVAIAFDDFGAGYAGANRLVEFQPDLIKLDMTLIRGIDRDPVRRSVVETVLKASRALAVTVIAEGVETAAEMRTLQTMGVGLMQGYLFALPSSGIEHSPLVRMICRP